MKSRHSILALALLMTKVGGANASDAFDCVHDLMPITHQADFQSPRTGVEKPFMLTDKFMVFPEITKGAVTGFFIYTHGQAWYYDSVEAGGKSQSIADLKKTNEYTLISLIAQPTGLETVTLKYMPGFNNKESNQEGPAILGSSLLPVVGGLVSRPSSPLKTVFRNPNDSDENDLRKWIYEHSSRKPAAVDMVSIDHQMMHLKTRQMKSKSALWEPLETEMKLRKQWVQSHNLNEESFRRLSRIMDGSCRAAN